MDEEGWKDEAKGVIKDIEAYVKVWITNDSYENYFPFKSVTVSSELPSTNSQIFLNLVTKEDKEYTVVLNSEGFKVVGFSVNTADIDGWGETARCCLLTFAFSETVYETPYSLLDNLSPAYREAFGQDLTQQLLKLQKQRGEEDCAE